MFIALGPIANSGTIPCCVGSVLSECAELSNSLQYDISACTGAALVDDEDESLTFTPIQACTTAGVKEYKQDPDDVCKSISRTCCEGTLRNSWSDWGKACTSGGGGSISCSYSTKPISSQSCTLSGGGTGTQTRTVTCNTSTGTWTTGPWSTCKCNKTCSGGQVFEESSCQCCSYGCYWFSGGSNVPYCNCSANYLSFSAWSECCTMSNGDEYKLPSAYSSCSSFASAMGLSLSPTNINRHACARI